MNERIPEIFTALTFLSIAVFFLAGNIVNILGIARNASVQLNQILSWLVFIFAIITAVLLLNDSIRKKED